MMLKIKGFGYEALPCVRVYIEKKDEIVSYKNRIEINWNCYGAVSISDAENFYKKLGEAIEYAKNEEEKLKK